MPEGFGDLAAGLALLGGGIAAWGRLRGGGPAALMLIAGVAWFAGDVDAGLLYAHRGPLVHLVLAYPALRVRPRPVAVLVLLAYVAGFVPAVARSDVVTITLFSAVVLAAAWRHQQVGGVLRRARASALAGAILVSSPLVIAAVVDLAGRTPGATAAWAFDLAVAATATGLALDLRWGGWTSAAVTGLVVELGGRNERQALRAALARALGDPGLRIAYRGPDGDGWLDETGMRVAPPVDGDGRIVAFVHENGEAVAALVHDPAALLDAELAASVAAAVRLAVANARMQAEITERVRDVSRSRRRLVEAGDQERHALREELRSGAERRLTEIAGQLAALASSDDSEVASAARGLAAELEGAREQLRGFAQGVYPRALTEHGLSVALAELAVHSAVPVTLDVRAGRLPDTYEAAAYFVCSEGLANVAKYAAATRAEITVATNAHDLVIRIADDGVGGADAANGSGLRGLTDRVEALGGALMLHSPPGAGTRLEARLVLPGTVEH